MTQSGLPTIQVLANSLDPQRFLTAQRRGALIEMAQEYPANAVRQAIRATAASLLGRPDEDRINPEVFISDSRQVEIMNMAPTDSVAAVDLAIRETAAFHLFANRTAH